MTDTLLPERPAARVAAPPDEAAAGSAGPQAPPVVLGAVTSAVSEVGDTLWAARSPGELLATVVGCERLRSVLDAVELGVVAEVDATHAARQQGWASTADYLTAVTGGRRGAGRRLLALARAVAGDRAATGAALASGAISSAQAEAVVTVVDRLPGDPGLRAAAEELLLGEARTRDAGELARLGPHVVAMLDPDGVERRDEAALAREERAAHHSRFLSITEDGIGGVRVKGRGSVEDAAHLTTVLFSLAAPQPTGEPGACGGTPTDPPDATDPDGSPGRGRGGGRGGGGTGRSCGVPECAHDGRDPREHGTRLWDALIEAATLLEGTEVLPESHGAKPRLSITLGYHHLVETLTGAGPRPGDGPGPGAGAGGWPAAPVIDTGGTLSATAVRRLACDAHHIEHWADGGATALHNLVLLCRTHHTMIHTTSWDVRLSPGDQRPEFLVPVRLDPERRPRRRLPLRT